MDYRKCSAAYYKPLKDMEKAHGLRQLISNCTRITKSTNTLLDLIFTNIEHISKSGTIDKVVSDHQPVYMIRKKPREIHENLVTRGRSYTDCNKVNYQNTIRDDVCWIDFWKEGKNVNDLWQIMYNSIVNAADTQCPERNIRLKSVRHGWMTINTIYALNDKYRLYKLAKSTKMEQDWVNYRQARNHLARILKHMKEQFIIQEIESCGDDTRKLWKELHKNLGSSKSNTKSFETIKDNNGNVLSGAAAYDYLNTYFTSVPVKLSANFDKDPWVPKDSATRVGDVPFEFEHITIDMITKLIKDINIHKSSATPRLSTGLLKDVKKLQTYFNISICAVRWFENYLTNRQQKIVKPDRSSTLKPTDIGVPQGSILGPTLFIMYVNDLFKVINNEVCKMIMYADDTVVYTSSNTMDEWFSNLERSLCSMIKWCNNNRLTLNIGKTKHMIIGPTLNENLVVQNNLHYNNKKIDIVSEYNYLGIELDNKLTMENHINKSACKASKKLYMIYKLRKCLVPLGTTIVRIWGAEPSLTSVREDPTRKSVVE